MAYATPALPHCSVWSLETLSRSDLLVLLDTAARRLKHAARTGAASLPLPGKNFALVGHEARENVANLLHAAAAELGAKVTLLPGDNAQAGLQRSARLLGRLYDAVDCTSIVAADVRDIERDAGVPVFNGLAGDNHPTRILAVLLAIQEASGKPLTENLDVRDRSMFALERESRRTLMRQAARD